MGSTSSWSFELAQLLHALTELVQITTQAMKLEYERTKEIYDKD
jgi:hypothetical protein